MPGAASRPTRRWDHAPRSNSGSVAVQLGRIAEAQRVLRAVLRRPGPESAGVRHLLLILMGQQGRLDDARRLIESLWDDRVAPGRGRHPRPARPAARARRARPRGLPAGIQPQPARQRDAARGRRPPRAGDGQGLPRYPCGRFRPGGGRDPRLASAAARGAGRVEGPAGLGRRRGPARDGARRPAAHPRAGSTPGGSSSSAPGSPATVGTPRPNGEPSRS